MTEDKREQRRSDGADAETAERNADLGKQQPEPGFPAADTEPYGDEKASNVHPEDIGGPTPEKTQTGEQSG